MQQQITATQWNELPFKGKILINHWKISKNYRNPYLNLGQCIEFLAENSYNLHHDVDLIGEYKDGSYFDHLLSNNESVIGWQGNELIAILWYEITEVVKQRLSTQGI